MHDACRIFVAAWADVVRPGSVVEVGSYNVNGTARDLFPWVPYTGIDMRGGPGVDVVADGATWRHPRGWQFDLVLCLEVLEHAPDPAAICRNLVELAAPGGLVLVTAAGPGRPPHGIDGEEVRPGEYYRPVTTADLSEWLRDGSASVLTEEVGEDVRAVTVRGRSLYPPGPRRTAQWH